jgi:hypothetical protein
MNITRRLLPSLLAAALCVAVVNSQAPAPASVVRSAAALPSRLSDTEFWRLSSSLSEPNGYFLSENLVSNEHTFQYVIPTLKQTMRPGGVYMGVAPDQNFTYILAVQPAMAFIVDIRRGNLLQHLMYKAIIELSTDRADFVSRLFSKKRPAGVGPQSTVAELFEAYDRVPTSEALYSQNLKALRETLLNRHGFPLSAEDLEQLEGIYFAFFWEGPGLRYTPSRGGLSSGSSGFGAGGSMPGRGGLFILGGSNFPSYEDLQQQADLEGQCRSYLSSEETFRALKAFEEKNLLVPVVGNFAGTKALRALGDYIRAHGSTVAAYYVSNVEQYLFQDGIFSDFARNVATLPVDDRSVFIRSVSSKFGYQGPNTWTDGRATALDPIKPFVKDFAAGKIRTYPDVNARSR